MMNKILLWLQKRIFLLVSIGSLFIATGASNFTYDLPYGFYQILRFLICGICVYFSYICIEQARKNWGWTLGITAFLFNPFIPIDFSEEAWQIIYFIVAIILLVFVIKFGGTSSIKIKRFWGWLTDLPEFRDKHKKYLIWFLMISVFLIYMFRIICIEPFIERIAGLESEISEVRQEISEVRQEIIGVSIAISSLTP